MQEETKRPPRGKRERERVTLATLSEKWYLWASEKRPGVFNRALYAILKGWFFRKSKIL
jgi:hypothetical protein